MVRKTTPNKQRGKKAVAQKHRRPSQARALDVYGQGSQRARASWPKPSQAGREVRRLQASQEGAGQEAGRRAKPRLAKILAKAPAAARIGAPPAAQLHGGCQAHAAQGGRSKAASCPPGCGARGRARGCRPPWPSTPARAITRADPQAAPGRQGAAAASSRPPRRAAAAAAANKKPVSQRHGFKTNEWIVYPAHGVGRIVGIEEQEIAGMSLELFVITFEKDKMTLQGADRQVGRASACASWPRRASSSAPWRRSKGRARVKRTMWSRRAQEYEAKINSGDLIAIAEVVRDLYRSESQPEQSYSERQLYEAALDRMAREIAAVEKLDERGAVQRITEVLVQERQGPARRRRGSRRGQGRLRRASEPILGEGLIASQRRRCRTGAVVILRGTRRCGRVVAARRPATVALPESLTSNPEASH